MRTFEQILADMTPAQRIALYAELQPIPAAEKAKLDSLSDGQLLNQYTRWCVVRQTG